MKLKTFQILKKPPLDGQSMSVTRNKKTNMYFLFFCLTSQWKENNMEIDKTAGLIICSQTLTVFPLLPC